MARNILIISAFYPPVRHVATNRIYSFAKYLSQKGHKVTVLTINHGEEQENFTKRLPVDVYRLQDKSIFQPARFQKKTNKFFHYVKCAYNTLLYRMKKNEYSGWIKAGLPLARKIIKEKEIDCIISSFPPLAAHEFAKILKKENLNLKWILDMRDAMSWCPRTSKKQRAAFLVKEKEFSLYADAVLSVSKPQIEEYKKRFEGKIFAEIRNGYDFEFILPRREENLFTIVFSGTFYGAITPQNFFQALNELVLEKKVDAVRVEIIGAVKPVKIPEKLKGAVFFKPRMPYQSLISYLRKNAALLLLILPKSLEKGVYSGKIFDYLGCGKPILGLVPKKDVAAQLIREANAGYIAENEAVDEIKQAILAAYKDWQNHAAFTPDADVIKRQHRSAQAERLNKLIEALF